MRNAGLPEGGVGSIVLMDRGEILQRSSAVLGMLTRLGFPFSLAAIFKIVPAAPRDYVYDWIARNRLKWFGRRQTCRLPTDAERHRFV